MTVHRCCVHAIHSRHKAEQMIELNKALQARLDEARRALDMYEASAMRSAPRWTSRHSYDPSDGAA